MKFTSMSPEKNKNLESSFIITSKLKKNNIYEKNSFNSKFNDLSDTRSNSNKNLSKENGSINNLSKSFSSLNLKNNSLIQQKNTKINNYNNFLNFTNFSTLKKVNNLFNRGLFSAVLNDNEKSNLNSDSNEQNKNSFNINNSKFKKNLEHLNKYFAIDSKISHANPLAEENKKISLINKPIFSVRNKPGLEFRNIDYLNQSPIVLKSNKIIRFCFEDSELKKEKINLKNLDIRNRSPEKNRLLVPKKKDEILSFTNN